MIRILRHPRDYVGRGFHRHGWPYAMGCLTPLRTTDGIAFEDFVEARFCYDPSTATAITEPWVGCFHHPPNIPDFAEQHDTPAWMMDTAPWKKSTGGGLLRGAICFSQYQADYWAGHLDCPVTVIHHPMGMAPKQWAPRRRKPILLQLGAYLRNTRLVFQTPPIDGWKRQRLWTGQPWLNSYEANVIAHWADDETRTEYDPDDVDTINYVSNFRYDTLLSRCVVITEVFDASANNVTLDCLARNTPLCINPHPAVVEYLGRDYPLYYEHPDEIPDLIQHIDAAHEYLVDLDKTRFAAKTFLDRVRSFVLKIQS